MASDGKTDQLKDGSLWSLVLRWALGQEANTIMLLLVVGGLAYFSPEALKRIQQGYERIEASQAEQVKTITSSQKEQVETIVNQHEKSDQRMSGLLRDILDLQRKRYEQEETAAARTGRPPDAARPN